MSRKALRKTLSHDHGYLEHMPPQRCGWDLTLAGLAYMTRMEVDLRLPDLNAWAARHAAPASRRYADLGLHAWVLWHGTTQARAEKIQEHGLFHKGGLWTTSEPRVAHVYCRGRSEQFQAAGAMVCILLDRRQFQEGRDFAVESDGNIFRFQHGLPAGVVEYILLPHEIRFLGPDRATSPVPWMRARFKRQSGQWVTIQKAPARYGDGLEYSTVEEFAAIVVRRLLAALHEVTAMDVFSTLYATVDPWDALSHEDVFECINNLCEPCYRRKAQVYRAAAP